MDPGPGYFLGNLPILSHFQSGSAEGTISIKEIIDYVEKKTGIKAIIDQEGENAPYNGEPEYSINTDKAKALGFKFSVLQEWIYELLDYYIELVK